MKRARTEAEAEAERSKVTETEREEAEKAITFSSHYWERLFKHDRDSQVARLKKKDDDLNILSREDEYQLRRQVKPIDRAHKLVADIRAGMEKFDKGDSYRSPDQVKMHEIFLCCCATLIYGNLFRSHRVEIMKHNNWTADDLHPLSSFYTPRRFGKTYGVALYLAVLLMFVYNCKIGIFAPGQDQTSAMLLKVRELIVFFWPHTSFEKSTTTSLHIKFSANDTRTIDAYSSDADVSLTLLRKRKENKKTPKKVIYV